MDDRVSFMERGRNIELERAGLDISKIDSFSDDNDLKRYINTTNKLGKNYNNYLFSISRRKYMHDSSKTGYQYRAFYETSPQTTGDSAEVSLYLQALGRGIDVKREVRTTLHNKTSNLLGKNENIEINTRSSDVVLYNKNFSTHIEAKVGLTRGTKKKYDLRQEIYGDYERLVNDKNTKQVYSIYRNANNGLSQLDDRDYANDLLILQDKVGSNRVRVFFEGRELSRQELTSIANRNKNIRIVDCLSKDSAEINGIHYKGNESIIDKQVDSNIRQVNSCNDNIDKVSQINPNSKINIGHQTNVDTVWSRFGQGFKAGAIGGAKATFLGDASNKIANIFRNGESIKRDDVVEILSDTVFSGIKSGVITGLTNIPKSVIGKQITGFALNNLGVLTSFASGEIGCSEMCTNLLGNIVQKGITSAMANTIGSTLSTTASVATASAVSTGSSIGLGSILSKGFKLVGGVALACAILSILFGCGGEITLKENPLTSVKIKVDENGKCIIDKGMSSDLVERLLNYNKKYQDISNKINALKYKKNMKQIKSGTQKKIIINQYENELAAIESRMSREIDRMTSSASSNYNENIRNIIQEHINYRLENITNLDIKINELKEKETYLVDQVKQTKYINDCCKQILDLEKYSGNNKAIKNLVSNMANSISSGEFVYKSNEFTTKNDILERCLGYTL